MLASRRKEPKHRMTSKKIGSLLGFKTFIRSIEPAAVFSVGLRVFMEDGARVMTLAEPRSPQ